MTLSRPFAGFAEVASHPALGPVPASADQDPEAFAAQPVGNGPFALKEPWMANRPGARPFDTCAYGVASVEGVQFVIAGETVSGYHQFQAGNLDICDVPVDQLEDAEETAGASANAFDMYPGERLVHGAEPGLTYLVCNTRVSPFDRAEFRRAVSCAIDRETLCRKALNYSAEPAWSLVAPTVGEMPAWEACTFDAERAVELVEALRSEAAVAAEAGTIPRWAPPRPTVPLMPPAPRRLRRTPKTPPWPSPLPNPWSSTSRSCAARAGCRGISPTR